MGVRLCGVTPADREKGIESQKARPVKLHSVLAQVGLFLCLEGVSAAFLSWRCTVAITICMMNLIFVCQYTDSGWLIDSLLGIWYLIFFSF